MAEKFRQTGMNGAGSSACYGIYILISVIPGPNRMEAVASV